MLAGKDFDRAIYELNLIDEALHRRFLIQFKTWCDKHNEMIPAELSNLLAELQCSYSENKKHDVQARLAVMTQLHEIVQKNMLPLISRFRQIGRDTLPTIKVWNDFLNIVLKPFKLFLSSTKNGNWESYEASKFNMLPLLFASNRTTYSKYLPVQIIKMKQLPEEIKASFTAGNFVAKLNEGSFNDVWIDYTLETTENKSLKGKGGIKGLTLKGNALARWFLSRPITATFVKQKENRLVC